MSALPGAVTRDIDGHVDRLLADLRGLKPPLPIAAVHQLLKIDLQYYSAAEVSTLGGVAHRMRIARHQLLQRPTLIVDVIRKLDLKGLWLPDQKKILVDSSLPAPKQRWAAGHEIIHSILSWHNTFTHGDRLGTLKPDCHDAIESEANYGASRLLFMGDVFDQHSSGDAIAFGEIERLSKLFGNSLAATLWRSINRTSHLAVGVLSVPPWSEAPDAGTLRHLFCSPSYSLQFGLPDGSAWSAVLAGTLVRRRGGPCGEKDHAVMDLRGQRYRFTVSCFNTHHAIMTIACGHQLLPTIG